jgi:hypothetical protein
MDESIQLDNAPKIMIVIGIIFIRGGIKINTGEMGLNHDIMAPALIAIRVNRVIGFIILVSSLICIWGQELEAVHMVTSLNRIE